MRNLIIIFSVLLSAGYRSQTDLYSQLKKIIHQTHPEINTDGKLLALNSWSIDDPASREANKSFDRTYSVYEYAKLKGGPKGIVVVAINKDNLSSMATITYTKDGIHKVISLGIEKFDGTDFNLVSNMIFDSSGSLIYKNLPSSQIFSSVNQVEAK